MQRTRTEFGVPPKMMQLQLHDGPQGRLRNSLRSSHEELDIFEAELIARLHRHCPQQSTSSHSTRSGTPLPSASVFLRWGLPEDDQIHLRLESSTGGPIHPFKIDLNHVACAAYMCQLSGQRLSAVSVRSGIRSALAPNRISQPMVR